jgi:tRNA pseudouridine55 synthase
VRTLAHDLGQKLGCGGHLCALRRTATDKFRIEAALPLEEVEKLSVAEIEHRLLPVYEVVPSFVA